MTCVSPGLAAETSPFSSTSAIDSSLVRNRVNSVTSSAVPSLQWTITCSCRVWFESVNSIDPGRTSSRSNSGVDLESFLAPFLIQLNRSWYSQLPFLKRSLPLCFSCIVGLSRIRLFAGFSLSVRISSSSRTISL